MREPGPSAAAELQARGEDPGALIDALRARGAARFDPVGLRFLEALARRAPAHRGEAGGVLARRLATALADYAERFERAERTARDRLAHAAARFPAAAEALRQHCEAGEFAALERLLAALEASPGRRPLAELLAHIGQHTLGTTDGHGATAVAGPRGELQSLTYFRRTWSKLKLDRQLAHAFAQAPENAGPLNSHFLVLQSLRQMRALSPDYLEQFVSYVDALLWLEQADGGRAQAQKNVLRGERERKRKAGRGGTA